MSNLKTQPIPPNCEMLGQYNDGTPFFRFVLSGIGHTYPLEEKDRHYYERNPDLRHLIAAVARCAWMDEAQREADAGSRCQRDGAKDFTSVHYRRVNECNENARLWREWGDAKHENH